MMNDSGFATWLGNFISNNPWPTITLIFVFLFIFFPGARFQLKNLLRNWGVRKLKFSGTEIEFGEQDKKIVQQSLDDSVDVIKRYRKKIENNINRLVQKTGLDSAFNEASSDIFEKIFNEKFGVRNMRATIHVLDFVFSDRLYQILNYYPNGTGAHRHFSVRMGIIGRVFRSRIPACAGYLTHTVAPKDLPDNSKQIADICLEWGLTETEAYGFKKKPSYCCIPIKSGQRVLGVFYMDCEATNFGINDPDQADVLIKELQSYATMRIKKEIPDILLEIEREMSDFTTRKTMDA